jgi:hypothetical protein
LIYIQQYDNNVHVFSNCMYNIINDIQVFGDLIRFIVFNATFSNISATS